MKQRKGEKRVRQKTRSGDLKFKKGGVIFFGRCC